MPLLASGSSEITTTALGSVGGLRATKKAMPPPHGGTWGRDHWNAVVKPGAGKPNAAPSLTMRNQESPSALCGELVPGWGRHAFL